MYNEQDSDFEEELPFNLELPDLATCDLKILIEFMTDKYLINKIFTDLYLANRITPTDIFDDVIKLHNFIAYNKMSQEAALLLKIYYADGKDLISSLDNAADLNLAIQNIQQYEMRCDQTVLESRITAVNLMSYSYKSDLTKDFLKKNIAL